MDLLALALIPLLAISSFGQSPTLTNDRSELNATVEVMPGAIFQAELAKSVDAKKAKIGDEVIAKTNDSFMSGQRGVVIPKGSKVLAHITSVSRHQGTSPSTLSIAFDKVELNNGTDFALKATILEIGQPELNPALTTTTGLGGVAPIAPSGPYGQVGNAVGMPVPGETAPGVAPPEQREPTAPTHKGLVKISGISLSAREGNVSTITSNKHDVKLDSGTELVIRVMP